VTYRRILGQAIAIEAFEQIGGAFFKKRRHGAIENNLQYRRDVTFHEDACMLAIGTASQAIALLNNFVLWQL